MRHDEQPSGGTAADLRATFGWDDEDEVLTVDGLVPAYPGAPEPAPVTDGWVWVGTGWARLDEVEPEAGTRAEVTDNAGSVIREGAEVLVVYPEGDADTGTVAAVDPTFDVNGGALVDVMGKQRWFLAEDVVVMGEPEVCDDCGRPVDDHDLRAMDGCPDRPDAKVAQQMERMVERMARLWLTTVPRTPRLVAAPTRSAPLRLAGVRLA